MERLKFKSGDWVLPLKPHAKLQSRPYEVLDFIHISSTQYIGLKLGDFRYEYFASDDFELITDDYILKELWKE